MAKIITENNTIKNIFMGIIKSFIITFILIILISAILVNTNISESIIPPAVFVITCMSIFVGAMTSIKNNGIIYGTIVGAIYTFCIYFLSSMLGGDFSLTLSSIILIVISILSGMGGGIVGVNIKRDKKHV